MVPSHHLCLHVVSSASTWFLTASLSALGLPCYLVAPSAIRVCCTYTMSCCHVVPRRQLCLHVVTHAATAQFKVLASSPSPLTPTSEEQTCRIHYWRQSEGKRGRIQFKLWGYPLYSYVILWQFLKNLKLLGKIYLSRAVHYDPNWTNYSFTNPSELCERCGFEPGSVAWQASFQATKLTARFTTGKSNTAPIPLIKKIIIYIQQISIFFKSHV